MVWPASRQTSTRRVASATSLAPHALKNSLPPPKVPVPRLSTGTLKPDPPSRLYSIRLLLLEVGARQGGNRVVRRSIPTRLFRCSTNIEHCSRMESMRQLRHPRPNEITLAGVLSALSDPVRLSVVSALADGVERGWGEFEVGVGPSTLSHHIKVLREAGVVTHRKAGTHCY